MGNQMIRRVVRIVGLIILMLMISMLVLIIMLPQMAEPASVRVSRDEATVARGEYLFNSVLGCPVCHSERDWEKHGAPPIPPLGGGRDCNYSDERPLGLSQGTGYPGTICFRNITPDAETGIGDWTDGEILRAIREGIDHDGNALFPIMPYTIYREISDRDASAVVAYLRTLPPVSKPLPDTNIDFPVSFIVRFVPRPVRKEVPHPNESDSIAYGEYLATVARCKFCHSPRDPRNRLPYKGQEFTGGIEFTGKNGYFYSTNLTPHETGIGNMSRSSFIELFRPRSSKKSDEIDIMPWSYFSNMSDDDLGAIYDYLMTLPPKPMSEDRG